MNNSADSSLVSESKCMESESWGSLNCHKSILNKCVPLKYSVEIIFRYINASLLKKFFSFSNFIRITVIRFDFESSGSFPRNNKIHFFCRKTQLKSHASIERFNKLILYMPVTPCLPFIWQKTSWCTRKSSIGMKNFSSCRS